MFTKEDYERLHSLVFVDDYSGYKPEVKELPNADGKVDADKRYAHVATKYMTTAQQRQDLMPYLEKAHRLATDIARTLAIAPAFMPDIHTSALRVLEYPPGAITNEHEDSNLFTLMLYRDQPDRFVSKDMGSQTLRNVRHFNLQAHMGLLGTEIGLGPATPHSVLPSETTQHSIVHFVIPPWASVLPSGVVVKDWLNERMPKMRSTFVKY